MTSKLLSPGNSNYGSTSNENTNNIQNVLTSPPPTLCNTLKIIFTNSRLNILLIFVPFGHMAYGLNWSDTWIFVLNFFAIIPLAKLLEFATENVSLRVGQTIGGLLNATFGNAVELVVSVVALIDGEIRVVQASMLGSIITSLLLVLGTSFIAGGVHYVEQDFNQTTAQTSSSLMTLACIGLIIPAAFNFAVGRNELLNLSRGTAIVLLTIYLLYLFFQLKTHAHLYADRQEDQREEPQLTLTASLLILAVTTVIVAFSAEFLVGSIEGIVESSGLSRTFVGLILLPIVGNAAVCVTAVTNAVRNKMNFSINVVTGSSTQIALFISPFLVILGWILGRNMTLFFHSFETVVLFITVLITNYHIQDGKSNWLEGAMLLATYIIIGLAFFFYP